MKITGRRVYSGSVVISDIEPRNTRGWPKTKQQYDLCQGIVVEGLSQADAGRAAGYAKMTVDKKLSTIVKGLEPYLAHLQESKREVIEKNWEVTVDRVVDELASIGFVNPKDYIRIVTYRDIPMAIGKPIHELTDRQALAISSWERHLIATDEGPAFDYRYTFYGKPAALADMGKHLGMFNEKLILEQRITKVQKVDLTQVPDEILEEWMMKLKEHAAVLPDHSGPVTIDNETGQIT